jgi:hypothetical protein
MEQQTSQHQYYAKQKNNLDRTHKSSSKRFGPGNTLATTGTSAGSLKENGKRTERSENVVGIPTKKMSEGSEAEAALGCARQDASEQRSSAGSDAAAAQTYQTAES